MGRQLGAQAGREPLDRILADQPEANSLEVRRRFDEPEGRLGEERCYEYDRPHVRISVNPVC